MAEELKKLRSEQSKTSYVGPKQMVLQAGVAVNFEVQRTEISI